MWHWKKKLTTTTMTEMKQIAMTNLQGRASDGIDFAFEGLFDHSDDDGDLEMLLGRNTNEESI